MIKDFLWRAFEETGDTMYYLEYRAWRICSERRKTIDDDRTDKTG